MAKMEEAAARLSVMKYTLLFLHLIFILVLVAQVILSFIMHGINPTLFLLTIFDLNSVIQLSETLQNAHNANSSASYIVVNSPSSEFLFVALTFFIIIIFNQILAIIAVAIRRNCLAFLVFSLIVNLSIFCLSVTFVKTNLFLILTSLVLLSIAYIHELKQVKGAVHQYATVSNAQRRSPENYHPATIDNVQMYPPSHTPSTPNDPKILAPIIYCPHYSESVC